MVFDACLCPSGARPSRLYEVCVRASHKLEGVNYRTGCVARGSSPYKRALLAGMAMHPCGELHLAIAFRLAGPLPDSD